jgi:hypothetical protein
MEVYVYDDGGHAPFVVLMRGFTHWQLYTDIFN